MPKEGRLPFNMADVCLMSIAGFVITANEDAVTVVLMVSNMGPCMVPEGYCQTVAEVEMTLEPAGAVEGVMTAVTWREPPAGREPRFQVTVPPAWAPPSLELL